MDTIESLQIENLQKENKNLKEIIVQLKKRLVIKEKLETLEREDSYDPTPSRIMESYGKDL